MTKTNRKLNLTSDNNNENIIESSSVTLEPISYSLKLEDSEAELDFKNLECATTATSVFNIDMPTMSDPLEQDNVDQLFKEIKFGLDNKFTKLNTIPDEKPVTTVEYRDFSIPVYQDDAGQQFYCIWEGQELGFGAYNTDFVDDLKDLIDRKLDIIYTFGLDSGFFGARLEWFDNAGNRDIQLLYRGRVLKVYLMTTIGQESIEEVLPLIIKDSTIILNTLIKALNK